MNINEKVTQVKTYIKEHKKQSIAVGLILLFLIGGSVALFAIPKSTGSAESGKDTSSMTVSDVSSDDTSSEEEASASAESEEPQEESTPEETPAESTAVESVTEENKPTDTKEPTKTETKKENTTNVPTTKPSTGGSTTNKPSTGGETKPSHTHSWVAQTKQVNHPEQGHNEQVLVKEAWTETHPIYENKGIVVCNGCGANITADPYTHNENHMLAGEKGGYHNDVIQVQVGVDTINHPAQYTTKYVVDKSAWTETVTTGHKCSCGATK